MSKVGFSIKALDTYEWPVDVKVPVVNPVTGEGEFEVHRFTGIFKHISLSESREMMSRLKERNQADQDALTGAAESAEPDDAATLQFRVGTMVADYQIALYADIWVGWGNDLTDEHGEPLPYSDDLKRKLLEERMIRDAVIDAHKASQGGEKVREKNS
ncbi:MAG: hypothetical protein M0P11_06895 [Anaerolineaceae bacterium]|nr:hypothetical protein [Anaerolineaceae bacterium]